MWLLTKGAPESGGAKSTKVSSITMYKSLLALSTFALLGASVVALPAFAPKAKAAETAVLVKADRLPVWTPAAQCAGQVWPNLEAACLRPTANGTKILEARLVTARR